MFVLTPMQEEAVKRIGNKDNVLLLSPTGSGKTLAFLLPILDMLKPRLPHLPLADEASPLAVIVVPSRELALQMEQVLKEQLAEQGSHLLLPKNQVGDLQQSVVVAESLTAPVEKGQKLGELTVTDGTDALVTIPITAAEAVPRLTWSEMYVHLLRAAFLAK